MNVGRTQKTVGPVSERLQDALGQHRFQPSFCRAEPAGRLFQCAKHSTHNHDSHSNNIRRHDALCQISAPLAGLITLFGHRVTGLPLPCQRLRLAENLKTPSGTTDMGDTWENQIDHEGNCNSQSEGWVR